MAEKELKKPNSAELEEYIRQGRERTKAQINTALRGLGLIASILLFMVAFDIFYEGSMFGMIFSNPDFKSYWAVMNANDFYDDIFYWKNWLPIGIQTLTLILIFIAMAYVIAFNVSDVIVTIKKFFGLGTGVASELSAELKRNVDESGINELADKVNSKLPNPFKKKKLFGKDDDAKIAELKKELGVVDVKPEVEKKDEVSNIVAVRAAVSNTPLVDTSKVERSEKELNREIDAILNDQSLGYEEAQDLVKALESNTIITNKKKLF